MIEINSPRKVDITQHLTLKASKGFSYNIPNNILLTTYPGIGIIYFLQCSVKFYDGEDFIDLHKTQNPISTLCLRGKWLAIGQKMLKGQLTTTTVMNLQTKKKKIYRYQKTGVEYLNLSKNGQYLSSIGSTDPQRQQFLIIKLFQQLQYGFKAIVQEQYDKRTQKIIMTVFSNNDPNLLAMIFTNKVTILRIEGEKVVRKVAKSSKVRQFSMGIFQPKDMSCYICSKNGDISDIDVKQLKQNRIGPKKRVIISGIKHVRYVHPNKLIITGVKGFIAILELKQLKILKQVTIKEQITSLTQFQGDLGFISTNKANIYILNAQTLDIKQFYQCHSARINQICFVDTFSEVFATCADNQIMLWRNYNLAPLIKISLPKSLCLSLNLLRDGSCIVSGWSDDCIRFFNPKTGKKVNQINNAHNGKVTALTSNINSDRLFSGGDDGRIRSWKLQKQRFGIIDNIFTSHKSQIHYLKLYDQELYACSQDGCFSIWNAYSGEKKLIAQASNFLRKVVPIDSFTVYGIGAGPYLMRIAKIDGKIIQKIFIGGSHLNDFDVWFTSGKGSKDQSAPLKQTLIFGGELHSIFLRILDDTVMDSKSKIQQYYAYGEVTCVQFSPDKNTVIGATADGSLICYQHTFK